MKYSPILIFTPRIQYSTVVYSDSSSHPTLPSRPPQLPSSGSESPPCVVSPTPAASCLPPSDIVMSTGLWWWTIRDFIINSAKAEKDHINTVVQCRQKFNLIFVMEATLESLISVRPFISIRSWPRDHRISEFAHLELNLAHLELKYLCISEDLIWWRKMGMWITFECLHFKLHWKFQFHKNFLLMN